MRGGRVRRISHIVDDQKTVSYDLGSGFQSSHYIEQYCLLLLVIQLPGRPKSPASPLQLVRWPGNRPPNSPGRQSTPADELSSSYAVTRFSSCTVFVPIPGNTMLASSI